MLYFLLVVEGQGADPHARVLMIVRVLMVCVFLFVPLVTVVSVGPGGPACFFGAALQAQAFFQVETRGLKSGVCSYLDRNHNNMHVYYYGYRVFLFLWRGGGGGGGGFKTPTLHKSVKCGTACQKHFPPFSWVLVPSLD